MKRLLYLSLFIALASCTSKQHKQTDNTAKTRVLSATVKHEMVLEKKAVKDTFDVDEQADSFADYYIVVADTGNNYYSLRDKMLAIKQATGLEIDTMNRYYNKKKNLIVLPDNDEDEVYAGDYLPRRTPSKSLSLEYLNIYKEHAPEKTIALVAGIFEHQSGADSALNAISSTDKNVFAFKAKVYTGCIH